MSRIVLQEEELYDLISECVESILEAHVDGTPRRRMSDIKNDPTIQRGVAPSRPAKRFTAPKSRETSSAETGKQLYRPKNQPEVSDDVVEFIYNWLEQEHRKNLSRPKVKPECHFLGYDKEGNPIKLSPEDEKDIASWKSKVKDLEDDIRKNPDPKNNASTPGGHNVYTGEANPYKYSVGECVVPRKKRR